MNPITDKITNAKKIAIALADARDEKGYTIEGDAIRALVSELETAKRALKRIAGVDSGYPCSCGELAQAALKGDRRSGGEGK